MIKESNSEKSDFFLFVDTNQTPVRIDKYLHLKLSSMSRSFIQNSINQGFITVNNKRVKASYKVQAKDKIYLEDYKASKSIELLPENITLDIVYEDDTILIINKPPNLVVHPGNGHKNGTLVNGLVYHYKDLPMGSQIDKPGLVHRIDKDTSGLLLVAKTPEALNFLSKQFANHTIKRTYQALVWGVPKKHKDTITNYLNRSTKDRRIRIVNPDNVGKKAITHYEVLENLLFVSLIQCRLETGRTHQIRVHLKHLGHPLFNDKQYGGNKILKGQPLAKYKSFVENCFKILPRQALHAKTLGFIHPKTKENIFFESPLPIDFQKTLEKWQHYVKSLGASFEI